MCVQYLEEEEIHNEAQAKIGLNWADLHKVPNNATAEEIEIILREYILGENYLDNCIILENKFSEK